MEIQGGVQINVQLFSSFCDVGFSGILCIIRCYSLHLINLHTSQILSFFFDEACFQRHSSF